MGLGLRLLPAHAGRHWVRAFRTSKPVTVVEFNKNEKQVTVVEFNKNEKYMYSAAMYRIICYLILQYYEVEVDFETKSNCQEY